MTTPQVKKEGVDKQRLPFYDYNALYSYNAVLNFVCGARGLGKTYGAKLRCVTAAIKKGHEFILLRRYKEELAAAKATFFDDFAAEFPDHVFRINGSTGEWAKIPEPVENDKGKMVTPDPEYKVMLHFVALSNAQNRKGTSYSKVKTVIFDEFIIEKGMVHYLPSEQVALLNFINTVDRYRDNVRVLMLANAVTMNNPYFDEYNIRPDQAGEWSTYFTDENGPFIVVHFPDSKDFQNEVYKTRFGRFIQDSEYAKYAVGNVFADAHNQLVEKKTSKAKPRYNLETERGLMSVWKDDELNRYFVLRKLIKQRTVSSSQRYEIIWVKVRFTWNPTRACCSSSDQHLTMEGFISMSQEQETPLSASPVEAKRQIGNVTTNVTLGTLVMTVVAWGLSEFGE